MSETKVFKTLNIFWQNNFFEFSINIFDVSSRQQHFFKVIQIESSKSLNHDIQWKTQQNINKKQLFKMRKYLALTNPKIS